MEGEEFLQPDGATPLDPLDEEGLIPTWIASRRDLNTAEQEGIAAATHWAMSRRWSVEDFDAKGLDDLHARMFSSVWTWAGRHRRSDTNLGVPWFEIDQALRELHLDLVAQVDADPLRASSDSIALEFHRRLVLVHPYPNGNGRHARLCADLVAVTLGRKPFSWGSGQIESAAEVRARYLEALRAGDGGDPIPLEGFARS